MTASKLCPHPECTRKIDRKANFCRQHTKKTTAPPKIVYQKNCIICGNSFDSTVYRAMYCEKCHETSCVICGKLFKSAIRFGKTQKTCSNQCGSKLAGLSKKKTSLTCKWCGKSFYSANGSLKAKYCSQKCRYTSKRKPGADKKRNSYKYRQWRDAVYTRDSYTCQQCGAIGAIQAHHIKPWKDHPELRYDVANGVTLCQTCHENIHGACLPRASKRFQPKCTNCGCETKGRKQYCKPCGIKLSPKAKKQRDSISRGQNGQFLCVNKVPL